MFVVRGRRVLVPEGERAAAVHIHDGIIARVSAYEDVAGATQIVDADDLLVFPGVVDTHVHVNEPGRTDWEGFDTATRAAAAGGVTTIIDMPLNSVPSVVDVPALDAKRQAARGQCHVDVGFWGGIVPGNERQIAALVAAGARGFKCFLASSGVDEFPRVNEADLRRALPILAGTAGPARPLLVHAENPLAFGEPVGPPRRFRTYLATRPVESEVSAVDLIATLAAEYDVAAHIVHLSSAEGLAVVAGAQSSGVPLTAETCPHYLTFAAEEIPDGATAFKCAPPIRSARHRDALWHGLQHRTCGMIASDHSPAPPAMKCTDVGDFLAAWGGIPSLELSLAAVWTGAASRGFHVRDVARWMCEGPAKLCGLHDRKGAIRVGCDADLVLWDPDAHFDVSGEALQQRHKLTPYEGRRLRGVVRATYVRGLRVWDEGGLVTSGRGDLL